MTDAQLRNLLTYLAVALLNILAIAVAAALAGGTMPGFREGEFLRPSEDAAVGLLALCVPLLTTWLAAHRPRLGSEGIAADVGAYKALGFHRADLTVVPKAGRTAQVAARTNVMLAPDQLDDLAERLLALRDAHDRAEKEARP